MKARKNISTRIKAISTVILISSAAQIAIAADWQTLPTKAPAPADNPTTAEKVKLGQILFFESEIIFNRDSVL